MFYCQPSSKLFFNYLDSAFGLLWLDDSTGDERSNDGLASRNDVRVLVAHDTSPFNPGWPV